MFRGGIAQQEKQEKIYDNKNNTTQHNATQRNGTQHKRNKVNNKPLHVPSSTSTMLLSPFDVLQKGFEYCTLLPLLRVGDVAFGRFDEFKSTYGSSPTVLAFMWGDLCEKVLPAERQTEFGFKMFLATHYFAFHYPRNCSVFAKTFGLSVNAVQGESFWSWQRYISSLQEYKIIWPEEEYQNPFGQVFICSVDGTDFKTWEKKHDTMPYDKSTFSTKFNHGAQKYEIAIDTYRSNVVWINGPFKGGTHDKVIFSSALLQKIPQTKKVIVDRAYSAKDNPAVHTKMCLPNVFDNSELKNFKARVRARHEGFNGRMKKFKILDHTFRHNQDYHGHSFGTVCVTLQYQMENGSPLFDA